MLMFISYLLVIVVVAYSGWIIYRTFKEKKVGCGGGCGSCAMNGNCPLQKLQKLSEQQLIMPQQIDNMVTKK